MNSFGVSIPEASLTPLGWALRQLEARTSMGISFCSARRIEIGDIQPMARLTIIGWNYPWDVTGAAGRDLAQYRKDLTAVFDLLDAGRLKPEIGEVMPLKEAPKAQQMLLDFKVQGKVVLVSG